MGRLLPDAFDLSEPGDKKLPHMLVHPVEKPVVIQEPALWSEKIVDLSIARENVVDAWQVVEDDSRNSDIESSPNLLRP
jgi:hypothetical protein